MESSALCIASNTNTAPVLMQVRCSAGVRCVTGNLGQDESAPRGTSARSRNNTDTLSCTLSASNLDLLSCERKRREQRDWCALHRTHFISGNNVSVFARRRSLAHLKKTVTLTRFFLTLK